jgi:N-acetyl sugar amidotransferase
MKYCYTCLEPDTRPNTIFTEDGLCPACAYYASLKDVHWGERFEILQDIIAKYKNEDANGYDCIIGVSGGKDSTRQALFVRDKLNLRPLLICSSYPPEQVSQEGVDNISNLINLGFTVLVQVPAPETYRKLVKESFFKFTNWARSAELTYFSSVPRIAIHYGIKLIIWGENPAMQVGDTKIMGKTGYDGNNLRNSNTLCSGHEWMLESGFKLSELTPYVFPTEEEFENEDINLIFLGWFLGDWSLAKNAEYSCTNGLVLRDKSASLTGDIYGASNLDEDWHLMNQMIKYYKFGFGKVTEAVSEEVREGILSRELAIPIVEEYDGCCSDKYIDSFCDYIGITVIQFWEHVHLSVNQDLFTIEPNNRITRKFNVGVDS